jgi:methionyl-tRNA synthetase
MEKIPFNDFLRMDLRVAKILDVEDIPNKDKLYKFKISLGSEERTLVAGIKPYYSKEQLLNKSVIMIANLEPAKIAGIESNGMLLAVKSNDDSYSLLIPDKPSTEGAKVE